MRQVITLQRLYLNDHYLGEIKKVNGECRFQPNEFADFNMAEILFIGDILASLHDVEAVSL